LRRPQQPTGSTTYLATVDFSASRFAIARSDDFIDLQTPLVVDDSLSIDRNSTASAAASLALGLLGRRAGRDFRRRIR